MSLEYTKQTKEVPNFLGTEEELQTAISNKEEIVNFKGGFEIDSNSLPELVPEGWLDSKKVKTTLENYTEVDTIWDEDAEQMIEKEITKARYIPVLDDEGNPVMIQKSITAYLITYDSINEGKILVKCTPPINENCCYYGSISSEELYKWIALFGGNNIHTKSNFKNLINKNEENNIY